MPSPISFAPISSSSTVMIVALFAAIQTSATRGSRRALAEHEVERDRCADPSVAITTKTASAAASCPCARRSARSPRRRRR